MYRKIIALLLLMFVGTSSAHELVPTYLKVKPYITGEVYMVSATIVNHRKDVEYYEVNAYDKDFKPIKTVLIGGNLIHIKHAEKKTLDIYFSVKDKTNITYVCTESKIIKDNVIGTGISSKICSKVK